MSKILIVDDNIECRNLVITCLKSLKNCEILQTESGVTVFAVIKDEVLDLILLDVIMANMNGFEVCKQIRSRSQNGTINIFMLTAKAEIEEVVKGLEAGADDYIRKPFDCKELRARVLVGLGGAKRR